MEDAIQPKVEMGLEGIAFTRSDGKTTKLSLIDDILEKGDAAGAINWLVLMKLHELTELMQVSIQQSEKLLALAGRTPEMPDPMEHLRTVLGPLGLKPEDLGRVMKQAMPNNGVSVSKAGGEG